MTDLLAELVTHYPSFFFYALLHYGMRRRIGVWS